MPRTRVQYVHGDSHEHSNQHIDPNREAHRVNCAKQAGIRIVPCDRITLYQATREDLMAFIGPLWMPVTTPRGDLLRIGRRPRGDLTTSLPRV